MRWPLGVHGESQHIGAELGGLGVADSLRVAIAGADEKLRLPAAKTGNGDHEPRLILPLGDCLAGNAPVAELQGRRVRIGAQEIADGLEAGHRELLGHSLAD